MTIRERIEAALSDKAVDRIPLTIYAFMLPRGEAEALLRQKGLGLICRTDLVRWEYPDCQVETSVYRKQGILYHETFYRTPVGEVSTIVTPNNAYGTSDWIAKHPFQSQEDYKPLEFLARNAQPVADYDSFRRLKEEVGEDGYVLGQVGYSPLMEMIVTLLGIEQYGIESLINPDPFWSLYEALCEKMRRAYPLFAKSPAPWVLYGGNIHPAFISPVLLRDRIMPVVSELADCLHNEGKGIGVHLDASNRLYKDLVAQWNIDLIEAFTPAPDCDMTVKEARDAWPDKILWCNFPSSVHAASDERIREAAERMLQEAAPGKKFLIGITEDIPAGCWRRSLGIIADTINEYTNLTP